MSPDVDRAVATRDAGLARLRSVTAGTAAAGAALLALFAGLAAASTHARKLTHLRAQKRQQPKAGPVHAPTPPLVPVPGADSEGSSAQPSAPQPPAAPPVPAPQTAPPVAVSGGS